MANKDKAKETEENLVLGDFEGEEVLVSEDSDLEFLNPFQAGVTYEDFLSEMGEASIDDYCKGKLSDEEIEFIKRELSLIKK